MKTIFLFPLLGLVLSSCNPAANWVSPTKSTATAVPIGQPTQPQACLMPLAKFSFPPTGGEREGPKPVIKLPADGWEAITTIPTGRIDGPAAPESAVVDTIQSTGDTKYVWVRVLEGPELKLIRYVVQNGQWQTIDSNKLSIGLIRGSVLFVDHDNAVWLPRTTDAIEEFGRNTPVLSIFEEGSQAFKPILRGDSFLDDNPGLAIRNVGISSLKLDSAGAFWFTLRIETQEGSTQYELYSFAPADKHLQRHLTGLVFEDTTSGSLVIGPQDQIYLLQASENLIAQYSSKDELVRTIAVPVQVVNNTSAPVPGLLGARLFVDRENRLWVDDRGWLDLKYGGDWQIVLRSSALIQYGYYGSGMWTWPHPQLLTETEDGRIWYMSGERGDGWVDPERGEWCLFTSFTDNIVQDKNGDLWMVAAGTLFEYSARP